jgi:hypothetical protein
MLVKLTGAAVMATVADAPITKCRRDKSRDSVIRRIIVEFAKTAGHEDAGTK